MRWMRRRGDRVRVTRGKLVGRAGIVGSNVFQKTVDYPNDLSNGFQVLLDTGDLVTVRWDQVEGSTLDSSHLLFGRPLPFDRRVTSC